MESCRPTAEPIRPASDARTPEAEGKLGWRQLGTSSCSQASGLPRKQGGAGGSEQQEHYSVQQEGRRASTRKEQQEEVSGAGGQRGAAEKEDEERAPQWPDRWAEQKGSRPSTPGEVSSRLRQQQEDGTLQNSKTKCSSKNNTRMLQEASAGKGSVRRRATTGRRRRRTKRTTRRQTRPHCPRGLT